MPSLATADRRAHGSGCCAWSAPPGCARTGRTRSARCRRRTSRGRRAPRPAARAVRSPRVRTPAPSRRVIALTTPSAPKLTRAARHPSGSVVAFTSTLDPSARTSSTECRPADRFGNRAPVPCVPVAVAPASDWLSMSPRFGSARPCACNRVLRSRKVIPASTRTRPLIRSTATMRFSRSSETRTPSVSTASVNECPDPATLTRRPAADAAATTSANSSTSAGVATWAGVQRWSPAQFTQLLVIRPTYAGRVDHSAVGRRRGTGESVREIAERPQPTWCDCGSVVGAGDDVEQHRQTGRAVAAGELLRRAERTGSALPCHS